VTRAPAAMYQAQAVCRDSFTVWIARETVTPPPGRARRRSGAAACPLRPAPR
jgi:hypothetical protein